MLGVHVEVSDSVFQYFDSYAGKSHALMTRWNSLAQFYHVELIFPFILENNPLISTESIISTYARIAPDSFDVVGWSKGTVTRLNTLQNKISYRISSGCCLEAYSNF